MAINAVCGHCKAKIKAKEKLAGKRVKCPKCSRPLRVPEVPAAPEQVASAAQRLVNPSGQRSAAFKGSAVGAAHNPLLNLLDEAGVESVPRGPTCENCGAELQPTAVVCVECGFNMATGQMLETTVYKDTDTDLVDVGINDADKIMAKAEQEIEDLPITAVGQDFGDGADSFVIAFGSAIVFLILVAIGVGVIFLMDQITEFVNSSYISFVASIGIGVCMALWITIVAFLSKPIQGVICLATAGLYCLVFGFMQGKTLLIPTIILLASVVIGFISYFFAFAPPEFSAQLLPIK